MTDRDTRPANDLFLRACRGEPTERTPTWIMRQAGRYLPEYLEVRAEHDFWTVCRTPELAARVTLQPIDRLGVDAAILFSDILVGFPAMGREVAFAPGPQLADPVRSRDAIADLAVPDPRADLGFVLDAIGEIRAALDGRVPLIGFGGAPLTLAAYLVEGSGSRVFPHLRALWYDDPEAADRLLAHLVEAQLQYLTAQIEAGAQALQIFDTWAGLLPRDLFERFGAGPVRELIAGLKGRGVPIIYYAGDCAHVLDRLAGLGADVLSLDARLPLDRAAELIGPGPALQGNLDSGMLLASQPTIEAGVAAVLAAAPADRGHVFNLGHGILPNTPVENAVFLVDCVRRLSARREDER
jgi:uroporphyrinogen decarboxylase